MLNIYHKLLSGLNYQNIFIISKKLLELDNRRSKTEPFPSFSPQGENAPKHLSIEKIHFMQSSIHTVFHNTKYDIITTAKLLKNQYLNINTIPKIHVWKDKKGTVWTLNHRRLAAAILAGLKKIPVIWVSRDEVEKNSFEFTTRNNGKSIFVYLTKRIGVVIMAT